MRMILHGLPDRDCTRTCKDYWVPRLKRGMTPLIGNRLCGVGSQSPAPGHNFDAGIRMVFPQLQPRLEAHALMCMTSSALRWASALALMAMAAAGADFSPARAQDSERPAGLFDIIFGGSERLAGERGAQPQAPERQTSERTAQ